jgi:hypothetical protein
MNPNEPNPFQNLGAAVPAQLNLVLPPASQPGRGKHTVVYAALTVGAVVLVTVSVLVAFRQPRQVVIRPPAPKSIVKREYVHIPPPPPAPSRPPEAATMKTTPEPPPSPPPKASPPPEPGPFDGAWRIASRVKALPCFTLQNTSSATKGAYAPQNVSGIYPFVAGPVANDTLEFSCVDYLGHRIHFVMKFESDTVAKAWTWRRAEDVLSDINCLAARRDLMPAQRQAQQLALHRELQLAGKRIPIGTFKRVPDPGQEDK